MTVELRDLPADSVARICSFLSVRDIENLACCCSRLRDCCLDDTGVWKGKVAQLFAGTAVNGAEWLIHGSGRVAADPGAAQHQDEVDLQVWPAQLYRCAASSPCAAIASLAPSVAVRRSLLRSLLSDVYLRAHGVCAA